jgi:Flp pilus assembly protein TadG
MQRHSRFWQIRRRGSILLQTTIGLIGILGVVALAIDGGTLMDRRVRVRAAADAAALAGADQLFKRYPFEQGLDPNGTVRAAVLAIAAANGYSNDGTNSTVTVNLSPSNFQQGRRAGQQIPAGRVEVIIAYNQPRLFSRLWGSAPYQVRGSAVGRGTWSAGAGGIIVLNPTVQGALTTTSSGLTTVPGAVVVNSSSATAVKYTSTGNIVAQEHDYTGNYSTTNSGHPVGTLHLGSPPVADPLAWLPVPTVPTTSWGTVNLSGSGSATLQPGHYTQIQVSGSKNVTLNPGLYYVDNGVSWSSSGTLTGNGVMFYNVANTFGLTQGSFVLTPMTSGVYMGVTVWQARLNTNNVTLTGSGTIAVSGTIYARASLLTLTGPSGISGSYYGSQTISDRLTMTGSSAINLRPPDQGPNFRRYELEE